MSGFIRGTATWGLFALLFAGCATGGGTSKGGDSGEKAAIKEPSPIDPKNPPTISLSGLGDGDLVLAAPVRVNVNVSHYPMEQGWQGAAVALNDMPPQKIYNSGQSIEFKDGLREGENVIHAYLLRSWGESVKDENAVAVKPFYFQKKEGKLDLKAPSIFLNSPSGSYSGDAAKKILFDFVVSGAQVNSRKTRVHYTLNGEKRELTNWEGYYFQNIPPGTYSLKVELVDSTGKTLKGPFTSSSSTFTIEK